MKGRVSMSQEIVRVELKEIDEIDYLVFNLDEEQYPDGIKVDLNSSISQADFKRVFAKLLELMVDNSIKLELQIAEGYSRGLYKDVCKEYINDLNKEIEQVYNNLQDEVSADIKT